MLSTLSRSKCRSGGRAIVLVTATSFTGEAISRSTAGPESRAWVAHTVMSLAQPAAHPVRGFTLLEIVLSLAILAGSLAALGEVMRLGDRNAETRQAIAVRTHHQLRLTLDLLQRHVARALDPLCQHGNLLALLRQHLEVRAEQLDGQLGLDPGEQFIDARGDGLPE